MRDKKRKPPRTTYNVARPFRISSKIGELAVEAVGAIRGEMIGTNGWRTGTKEGLVREWILLAG